MQGYVPDKYRIQLFIYTITLKTSNMSKNLLLLAAVGGAMFTANQASAQDAVLVEEESVTMTPVQECKDHYYSTSRNNWFIQIGAGANTLLAENWLPDGGEKHHFGATYNLAFGKWMSPYLGWRLGFNYSVLHWDDMTYSKARTAGANFDIMWDMFNSFGNVNSKRAFSIIPFVGLGGAYTYDYDGYRNIEGEHGLKKNSWTLPVSAGLQLRFRLCSYADFFLEGRALFAGDNYNNVAWGGPIDINISAIGGFIFNLGGSSFKSYNPCNDAAYMSSLNNQINDLRAELAATAGALAVAESQLPCPPQQPAPDCPEVESAPMLTTVQFRLNSADINAKEMVNVYNVAEYLKENPDTKVTIVGYADKDTGTSEYNLRLSKRRAQAVYDALTKTYNISADRLTMEAEGSSVQPYATNDWNRIVIFIPAN